MGVYFGGRYYETPTTASVVNDDALRNQNLTGANAVAFIGKASGGQPKTILRFRSTQEAKDTLVSGELLDAVLAGLDPSDETGGPSEIIAVRIDPATQATLTLKNASAANVINLTSQGYGANENLIRVKIEAGTTSGLRLTAQRGSAFFTKDNVERKAFSIVYTGAQTTATLTMDGTTATLAAPAGTTVATIALSDAPTVRDLVDRINLVSGFSASVLDNNYTAPTVNGLDFVTAQSVKTTAYTAKADLQACIDWFNSTSEGFVTATRVSGAGAAPAVLPFTFLAGGTTGTVTSTDWADGFTALQTADVRWITPITSDASVHAQADAHVQYMSTTGRRERRAICGMANNSTDTNATDAAKLINSDRTSLVHLGPYLYDNSGNLALYPPYILAAMLSAMFAAVAPGTPLTNKQVKIKGIERTLRNPTDTDVLIRGGVLCIENADGVFKVVKSISTCLWSTNYNRVEQSTGSALDYAASEVRKAIDKLRGNKSDPMLLRRYVSVTESTLRELAKPEPQGPGILVGDDTSPAYKNITAKMVGDVVGVSFQASPAIPNNFALATIYAVPFSGTATA